MNRRNLLAAVGAVAATGGLVGCLDAADPGEGTDDPTGDDSTGEPDDSASDDQNGDALPEECPVDTLEGHDPPEEVDRERVETFVKGYEPAYVVETMIDRKQYDRVERPGSSVEEVTPTDGGYVLEVHSEWGTWAPDRDALEFERVEEAGDAEPVPIDHEAFEGNDALREEVVSAVEDDRSSTLPERRPDYHSVREDLEAAAGRVNGAVVEYQGELVRVTETAVPGVHGDHFERAAYYVAPGVVYRADDHEADPRDGTLMEC